MKKQDSGYGIQDTETRDQLADTEPGSLNSVSHTLDPVVLERVRWRCRRGLLELDIVLGRFVEQRYAAMDNQQRVVFDEMLDMSDTELWDVITGKKEPVHAHQREVLEWLEEA